MVFKRYTIELFLDINIVLFAPMPLEPFSATVESWQVSCPGGLGKTALCLSLVNIKHSAMELDSVKCRTDMSDLSDLSVHNLAFQCMVPFHNQSISNHDSFVLHSLIPLLRAYYLSSRPVPRCFPTSATVFVEHHHVAIQ